MNEIKLGYMKTACSCAGFYIMDKELDLLLSLYELIEAKRGNANLEDVARVKSEVELRHKQLSEPLPEQETKQ